MSIPLTAPSSSSSIATYTQNINDYVTKFDHKGLERYLQVLHDDRRCPHPSDLIKKIDYKPISKQLLDPRHATAYRTMIVVTAYAQHVFSIGSHLADGYTVIMKESLDRIKEDPSDLLTLGRNLVDSYFAQVDLDTTEIVMHKLAEKAREETIDLDQLAQVLKCYDMSSESALLFWIAAEVLFEKRPEAIYDLQLGKLYETYGRAQYHLEKQMSFDKSDYRKWAIQHLPCSSASPFLLGVLKASADLHDDWLSFSKDNTELFLRRITKLDSKDALEIPLFEKGAGMLSSQRKTQQWNLLCNQADEIIRARCEAKDKAGLKCIIKTFEDLQCGWNASSLKLLTQKSVEKLLPTEVENKLIVLSWFLPAVPAVLTE